MASRQEVERVLEWLVVSYPGKFQLVKAGEFSTADVYAQKLADVPFEAVKAAVAQWTSEAHDWPPNAGQLRTSALALIRPALPAWADAWDEVLTTIRRIGYYGTPAFSHPLITQAVQGMGGWQTMCQMEITETSTWRAQFRDVFNAYANRAESEMRLLPAVRSLAVQYGALPAPVEMPNVPALPAPVEPSRTLVEPGQSSKYAEYIRRFRAEARAQREAHGRAVVGGEYVQSV